MQINDEFEVKIEKLSNLGTGIARVEGIVIFVENACPEDVLKIKITKVNKNYATAKILAQNPDINYFDLVSGAENESEELVRYYIGLSGSEGRN